MTESAFSTKESDSYPGTGDNLQIVHSVDAGVRTRTRGRREIDLSTYLRIKKNVDRFGEDIEEREWREGGSGVFAMKEPIGGQEMPLLLASSESKPVALTPSYLCYSREETLRGSDITSSTILVSILEETTRVGESAFRLRVIAWQNHVPRKLPDTSQVPAESTEDVEQDIRIIYPNSAEGNQFINNSIRTAKYNFLTFIPLFLFEQFMRWANVYFLIIIGLQQIPGISPTGRWTTLGTLSVVMTFTAIKEIYEDLKRHRQDRVTNKKGTQVIRGGVVIDTVWKKIAVGDIVKVENRSYIPADLILLSSSEPSGLCYVETANLDGETNLKSKQAIPETTHLVDLEAINRGLAGSLCKAELPNSRLYNFSGSLQMGGQLFSLEAKQTLLRGSMLRNTKWIYGLVVYTGKETKLMKNSAPSSIKKSNVEQTANKQIVYMLILLIAISILCTIGYAGWLRRNSRDHWYLELERNGSGAFMAFLTFVILYNNFIPISLYVSVELVKLGQAYFMNNDAQMYDPISDTPAQARTSNLNEELGQVEYIFSDKTGTLTCNKMEFKRYNFKLKFQVEIFQMLLRRRQEKRNSNFPSIFDDHPQLTHSNNIDWYDQTLFEALGRKGQDDASTTAIEAMRLLSVCHTVIPEETDNGIVYQASSPDEAALVKAAKFFGYNFHKRTPKSVSIRVGGADVTYQVLNVLEFTNERKRMSVIVRDADYRITLYTKGADSVIYERLAADNVHAISTRKHLDEFAAEGLRTLCLAKLDISQEDYEVWQTLYHKASTKIGNREAELARVAEMIEKNLFLIGATAVEDQLQQGVPETIATLAKAGIKIWVLTGDKQETAINIGYSCRLLTNSMDLMILNKDTEETTRAKMDQYLDKYANYASFSDKKEGWGGLFANREYDQVTPPNDEHPLALIIDGSTLHFALNDNLKMKLLTLATKCKAVICCRVTPGQKAAVVRLVRQNLNAITLAIGDGANDEAHVGVGISGEEGLQAARASDYAIAQFRFLRRLLLVHGHNAYRKVSKLILYSFYKNVLLYLIQFWFTMNNGFSGQSLFERWTIAMYNVLFTLLPAVIFGIGDREVSDKMIEKFPELYRSGIQSKYVSHDSSQYHFIYDLKFNNWTFWSWIVNAVFHSLLAFFIPYFAMRHDVIEANGQNLGLWGFGSVVFSCAVLIVSLKLALETRTWNWIFQISLYGSMGMWIVWLLAYGSLWSKQISIGVDLYKVGWHFLDTPYYYFLLLLVAVVALYRDVAWKYLKRTHDPNPYHIVQELQYLKKKNVYDITLDLPEEVIIEAKAE
ncbi:putative phospholipid-transporting ATPase IA [Planoprotostelium fungivorum]|uniref:Phospholipid-transporting ATPase n=1 Tax=Planoprotostelium fungivorum TaxID=1890364 RepID=A0A2P6N1H4_9EUKA|nr:putative phospholipid-transporting ATPase IA [Planoprotostelium fungivorum]